ncbi:putative transmembrane protein [Thalictrum thalictroides]|uniref:Putative transmembrane protein n=1 Tax=Thalictrum thalictroides TaxID=46969 RepID=A0A7J6W4B3_THATH|nr:putative transmembrane protein [Thalictrum thalictroides]
MEKNFTELLSEELKLREVEALDNQRHADMALLEAKKMASQYQKEADKCNSGMETCEEAREKAEDALVEQRRLTATWELRARQRGWKEGLSKSHSQS